MPADEHNFVTARALSLTHAVREGCSLIDAAVVLEAEVGVNSGEIGEVLQRLPLAGLAQPRPRNELNNSVMCRIKTRRALKGCSKAAFSR